MDKIEKRLNHYMNLRHTLKGTINAMAGLEFVQLDVAARKIIYQAHVEEWMLNPGRMLHGGISAVLVDMAMGGCAFVYSDAQYVPTISMTTQYVKTMRLDDRLIIHAQVNHLGREVVQTQAFIYNENNELCLSAIGAYAIKRKRD